LLSVTTDDDIPTPVSVRRWLGSGGSRGRVRCKRGRVICVSATAFQAGRQISRRDGGGRRASSLSPARTRPSVCGGTSGRGRKRRRRSPTAHRLVSHFGWSR